MAYYAQTNYSQLQGMTVNGKHPVYSIAQIGCFITSFCNLEARFGRPIAPDALDNALAAKGLYIDVDDGVYDDVGWGTICGYDPKISVSRTGSGLPPSDNCIVKFIYNSFQTGRPTTHFCLVASAANKTIVDSWDGQVKSWNAYPGGPQAWAEYVQTNPQPVTPVQGEDMAMTADFVTKMYTYVAGRTPTAGEVSGQVTSGTPASLLQGFITNGDLATKRLGDQITALESQLATTNKTLTQLQTQVNDLQKQLGQADDASAALKASNADLTNKLASTQKALDTQTKANDSLTKQLAAKEGSVSVGDALSVLVNAIKKLFQKG